MKLMTVVLGIASWEEYRLRLHETSIGSIWNGILVAKKRQQGCRDSPAKRGAHDKERGQYAHRKEYSVCTPYYNPNLSSLQTHGIARSRCLSFEADLPRVLCDAIKRKSIMKKISEMRLSAKDSAAGGGRVIASESESESQACRTPSHDREDPRGETFKHKI